MTPELEIHLPISPTPTFFTMVHYFAASLRLNGGSLANSRIVVTVGDDREPEDLHALLPWSRLYPIEWSWADREIYRRHSYYGTALERFRRPFQARNVMIADADTFFAGSFEGVVAQCREENALGGLIAHQSPFKDAAATPSRETWTRIFEAAGLGSPPFICEHTGWIASRDRPDDRYCPPYFNLGMLIAPADVMARVGAVIYTEMAHVDSILDTHYRCQIALALAVQRLGLRYRPLAMRYNCVNDEQIMALHPADRADVRLYHYLRRGEIDKARDFESPQHVEALLAREDLTGVNRELARHLAPVHEAVEGNRSVR
jgi:hypothetical protein